MAADFSEFGAWHSSVIWEDLEGFAGYDCVKYVYWLYRKENVR